MHSNSAVKLLPLILLGASCVVAQSVQPKKDIPTIAKAANGAVVSIVMSDKNGNPVAQGSGFIVSKDGLIVTNYHVIAEGTSAVVKLPDGAFYLVDGVLASDKARDIAIIKAHGEHFRTLPLGDSNHVQVGQEVVAIGNPLSLESTVSNGIVSSIRTIDEKSGKYLQVTAPISPGSSGGPLFNMEGQVVGITTMYLKGGENLNFAIPINDAKPLLETGVNRIKPFANNPTEQQEGVRTTAAMTVQISSPAFKYYKGMLAAHQGDVIGSTYACFNDNPTDEYQAESFRLIRVSGGRFGLWSVDILNVEKVAIGGILGYDNYKDPTSPTSLKLDADGKIHATFSSDYLLADGGASESDEAIHKDDYLEWSSEKISFQYGTYQPPSSVHVGYDAISFTMGRPSGTYVMTATPEGNVFDGRLNTLVPFAQLNPGPAYSETGQCVRIPGSRTFEERLRESSQQR